MIVFISSTATDLKEHRSKVSEAILRLGYQPVQMEYFGAIPNAPVDACRRKVTSSDVLAALVAWRYGWVPTPDDGGDGKKCITWLEVEAAIDAGIPVFSFIVDPEASWAAAREQDRLAVADTEEEAVQVHRHVQSLKELKRFLEEKTTRVFFGSSDELAQLVVTSLAQWERDQPAAARRKGGTATRRTWKPRVVHALQPSPHFQGRDDLLNYLGSWWSDRASPDRVLSIVAPGGTGKTAVTEQFLKNVLAGPHDAGVFVWSFYESPAADRFFREALAYFVDDTDTEAGGRLSKLQTALSDGYPHLLVLDGLESVQAEGRSERLRGALEDHALKLLLRSLASGLGNSHALVTSRFPLTDLEDWKEHGYRAYQLTDLEAESARRVLDRWGVRGDAAGLDALAAQVGRHALSLSVIGSYLASFRDGDVSKANALDLDLEAEEDPRAAKLKRILAAYSEVLSDHERMLLGILSTFPHGVNPELLHLGAVALGPDHELVRYKVDRLTGMLSRLHRLGLVFSYAHEGTMLWSAHPFLRQHFARLPGVDAERVHEAVGERMGASLERRPGTLPRDTESLDRYEQLIEHVRLSGNVQEAFDLFWHALGRYNHLGASLGEYTRGARILARFAEAGDPAAVTMILPEEERAALVSDWGHFNKDLGDLATARRCHWQALPVYQKLHEWKSLAKCRVNIADIDMRAGNLPRGIGHLEEAVALANVAARSHRIEPLEPQDHGLKIVCLGTLAKALHMMGEGERAKRHFDEALNLTGGMPDAIFMRQRAEWLRDLGRIPDALASARMSLSANEKHGWYRDVARVHALLGDLMLSSDLSAARHHHEAAQPWCERTDDAALILDQRYLAARIARLSGDLVAARKLATEGLDLARGCGFRINQIHQHLELCRIHLKSVDHEQALIQAEDAHQLAADPGCRYAWGKADALYLAGMALLGMGEATAARDKLGDALIWHDKLEHPQRKQAEEALGRCR
jgi:tetratricopeptide (TPR) repeat protein